MQTGESILGFLRTNKAYIQEHFGIEKIGLFGSYARNEQTAKSDIDILIPKKSKR